MESHQDLSEPHRSEYKTHSSLRLKNVLHAPSVICNIIGYPILEDYNVITSPGNSSSGTILNLSDNRQVAYFKPMVEGVRFFEVRLRGPPYGPQVGPSPFDPDKLYMIHARWPDSERQRFSDFVISRQAQTPACEEPTLAERAAQAFHQTQTPTSKPLTPAEKKWLKENFGNEFKFLRLYGLNIFKEEDREEGRAILRGFISDDNYEPMD